MNFELKKYNINVPDDDLLHDIQACAQILNKTKITIEEYDKVGKFSSATIRKRFGNWHQALKKAGLDYKSETHTIAKEELLQNLKNVWEHLGRQPTYKEIKYPLSKYSIRPYENLFGTWQKALEVFVNWINEGSQLNDPNENIITSEINANERKPKRRTNRNISDRLRFSILLRDGFRCQSCGESPIKNPGIELHVDHIIPWSKGGETVPENLQTKCQKCNLGKGNAFNQ